MLSHFFNIQQTKSVQEKKRLSKISKLVNQYDLKQAYLHKYGIQPTPSSIYDQVMDYHNINAMSLSLNKVDHIKSAYDFVLNIVPPNNKKNDPTANTNTNTLLNSLQAIHIVYQPSYLHSVPATGYGDFIRGAYYMLQFSKRHNIPVTFHMNNHPIKPFLANYCNMPTLQHEIASSVPFFEKTNHVYSQSKSITYSYIDIDADVMSYVNSQPNYNGHVYIYLINHPIEKDISLQDRETIRNMIQPTPFLQKAIQSTMETLCLIPFKYKVVHIRTHDSSISTKTLYTTSRVNAILRFILSIMHSSNDTIFLLSTDVALKSLLLKYIPTLKTNLNKIAHVSHLHNDDTSIINTLVDFYVMSQSNSIYSLSVYQHGSGFSKWCAVTYNIPYVCYSLSN